MFSGNKDYDTVAYNTLIPPITTRYIRILPVQWQGHISMRIELYGCPGTVQLFQYLRVDYTEVNERKEDKS